MATVTAVPSYYERAFNPAEVQKIVAWAVEQLKAHNIQAIAARGLSGLVIAGAIGHAAQIPVFAVRQDGHHAHADRMVSGLAPDGPVERWAFVDDLIETGRTLFCTRTEIHEAGLTTTKVPSLILLYGDWNRTAVVDVDAHGVVQLNYQR